MHGRPTGDPWAGRRSARAPVASPRARNASHLTPARVAVLTLLALAMPVAAMASVTLLSYPQEMLAPTDRATVTWEEPVRCYIAYGPAPGVYTSRTATEAVGELVFVPAYEGMEPGLHFCVVREVGSGGDSQEFQLIIESTLLPELVSPPNGGTIEEATALLEWDPVDGVPYYHVVVSDSEVEISEEDGEIRIHGANIVWQAITSGTSIGYGGVDPSRHFDASNGVSPPLMAGFDYNWLVFNNYGNHPLFTSAIGAGIAGFSTSAAAAVDAPALVEPADSVVSAEDVLTFDWEDVPGAAGYHFYMHERREWAGGEASYPVWDASTSVSEIDVHLGGVLTGGEYYWRVVALDGAGAGACSESRRLNYETDTGEARIVTTDAAGNPLPWVFVEIQFASGGVKVLPAITNEDGIYNKELVPGEYTFHATKEGHVDTTEQASIRVDQTTQVGMSLRIAPARVRGTVENEDGEPVFGALVAASSGANEVSAHTNADGNFVLTVTGGEWTVAASKQGYESSEPTVVVVAPGDYVNIGEPLIVRGAPGTLTGTVVNFSGNPLAVATVEAEGPLGLETATTGAAGGFAMELAPGVWTVHAEKSGFQESSPREFEITPGSGAQVDPPIVLSPIAASVSGRVTDGAQAVANARVVAVPRTGGVFETITNNYGEFVLLPDPTDYVVRACADGYAPSGSYHVSIDEETAFTGVALELAPLEAIVRGTVTDGESPVAQSTVSCGDIGTLTDGDGAFELRLPRGLHEVTAGKTGFFSGPSRLVGTAPEQVLDGLALSVAGGASSASGTVTCEGSPVPGARVDAIGDGGESTCWTGPDGAFSVALESGRWVLSAEKDGFAPAGAETLTLSEGQSATGVALYIDDRSATLTGTIRDGSGPVRRADLLVYEVGRGLAYATSSNSFGNYTLRMAPCSEYVLRALAVGRGAVTTDVPELTAGQTRRLDVVLPTREGLIEGVVTSAGDPVERAEVTAVWGDSASVVTDRLGRFGLWLDDGLYDVRVVSDGHETSWYGDLEVVSGEVTELYPELEGVHASMSGVVTDSLSGAPVEGALVTAVWTAGGASCITDALGEYELASLVPGEVSIRCDARGYRSVELSVSLAPSETVSRSLRLLGLSGTIAGTASLDVGGALQAVQVRARLDGEIVATAETDGDGMFLIADLDPSLAYELRAGLNGHYCTSPNPLVDVPTGTLDASFTFRPCTGLVGGHVYDDASGEPLENAQVRADDGNGHFGQVSTGPDGAFLIEGLVPEGEYIVTASLFGYHQSSVVADPGTGDIELRQTRNFARLQGRVSTSGDDLTPDDVTVVATSTSYAGGSSIGVPDPGGAYDIADIRPGAYLISVAAEGCLASPAQLSLELGEGETVTGLDFTVERATVVSVELAGPTTAAAGDAVVLTADAVASGNRVVDVDLDWWLSPNSAGYVSRGSGRVELADDYIGEATVAAIDRSSGTVGRHAISVYAPLAPGTSATFSDSTGMSLRVAPGAVEGATSVYLSHERVPDSKRYRKSFTVSPTSYNLKPAGLSFASGHEAELRLPAEGASSGVVRWDHDELRWVKLESDRSAGCFESDVESLGEYGIRSGTRPLGVEGLTAEPNPFSPQAGPVEIRYDLSSIDARMPFVTVRVFNMAAQLVRVVVENEPQAKGRASVQWDGLTDDGEAARNGRYVVEVVAEDASGTESALASVVLVK